jgi:hypothetical protein
MRRLFILICLVVLAWFAFQTEPTSSNLAATPQQSCCAPGTGDNPHRGCVSGVCQDIYECGFDDCSACTGCDPQAEQDCILMGWEWDPVTCTCNPPHCDPIQEQECIYAGGTWDDVTCTCALPCNPGPPQLASQSSATYDECRYGVVYHCTVTWSHYVQYCQDGSVYDSWTEEVTTCYEDSNSESCYS